MKTSKLVGIFATLVQFASLAAFGLTMYTVYGVLSNSMQGGMDFDMTLDEATGVGTLSVELAPSNPSYLEAEFTFELSLLDSDNETVASGSDSVRMPPGSSGTLSLELEVSRADIERIATEGSSLEVTLSLRTLYDLVGFSDTLTLEGGVPA